MKLFIGTVQIPIKDKSKVAQTKQVNDLFSLNTRQTNYTNSFEIEDCAETKRAFELLGITGNLSSSPYTVQKARLFGDSGRCYIYDGLAEITEFKKGAYQIQLVDGNVDLWKAIDNAYLSEIPMPELVHNKTVGNIYNTWLSPASFKYRYIVADYNGKMTLGTSILNADYLVPSASVEYIWQKIFEHYGYTYSGSVFDSPAFKDMYMTYPKGIESSDTESIKLETDEGKFFSGSQNSNYNAPLFKATTYVTNNLASSLNGVYYEVADTSQYRVTIEGNIATYLDQYNPTMRLWAGKNAEGINSPLIPYFIVFTETQHKNVDFTYSTVINLNAGDSLCFGIKGVGSQQGSNSMTLDYNATDFKVTITKIEDTVIDFSAAFTDFKVKDLFNEILIRFCLIPFRSKYTNQYVFKTFDEFVNQSNIVDWSAKFKDSLPSEKYLYGGYARRNWFRFSYNDSGAEYYDFYVDVDNVNLEEARNVIKSKTYAPDRIKTSIFGRFVNVFRMWDKNVSDDASVTYRAKENRYHLLGYKTIPVATEGRSLKSEYYEADVDINKYHQEVFDGIDWLTVISQYYTNIGALINNAKVVTCKMKLTEQDVSEVDFSKMYYIKQLGGYFILNKISNFRDGFLTTVELIRVNYSEVSVQEPTPDDVPEEVGDFIIAIEAVKLITGLYKISCIYNSDFTASTGITPVLDGVDMTSTANDGYFSQNVVKPAGSYTFRIKNYPSGLINTETIMLDLPA